MLTEEKLFEIANNADLSVPMGGVFVRFWKLRFPNSNDVYYAIEWAVRFRKGFEELWGRSDTRSQKAIAEALFGVIE